MGSNSSARGLLCAVRLSRDTFDERETSRRLSLNQPEAHRQDAS